MIPSFRISLRRAAAFAAALCLLAALTLALPLSARADSGDLDEILSYALTVTPNADGTLAMTAAIDWKVLDDSSEGPLEWVQIGLPNTEVTDVTALTPETIGDIYPNDDSYMIVYFDRTYYEDEVIHFSYAWTQSYMYTLGEDGSVNYSYTPGWFDAACVDRMSITWNDTAFAGSTGGAARTFAGTRSDGEFALSENAAGALVLSAEGLSHGEQLTLTTAYPAWPTALSAEQSAAQYEGPSNGEGSDDGDAFMAVLGIVIFTCILFCVIFPLLASSWEGGFGAGVPYVYVHGLYYPRGRDGRPVPGATGVKTPPTGHGMGGGRSGGGGGRSGGGCACASSCACACACACAGGGRAGCSAKNLYAAIHLPESK